ncbi:MAG: glycosyltransferase family 4 protein [Flavobacteriaceae bacterium]|nr:glycosyltransferase family 4 protein [Flavobacteriaceae bacterium]
MKKELSILFLCGWYPSKVSPLNGDFIQRHAETVATKHKVTVFHIITNPNYKSIQIEEFIKNNVVTHIVYLPKVNFKIQKILLFFKAFKSFLKDKKFDVCHLNEVYPFGLLALYLKWFKNLHYIISEHWTGYHKPQSKNISFLQKILTKRIVSNAKFVCPVSNDLANSMISLGLKGNYRIVPNVVDTDIFYPSTSSTKTFTITHISNMVNEHKNVKGILRVIKSITEKVDDYHFNLIGHNSKQYLPYINEINLDESRISIIEQIPHKKVAEYLQNSDVFVLFSNYENLPCVILEAFACGVPVVSSNVGGIHEFFPKNFGYLVEPRNESVFLSKILDVYSKKNKAEKDEMFTYVKDNFSKKKILSDFENLYIKL